MRRAKVLPYIARSVVCILQLNQAIGCFAQNVESVMPCRKCCAYVVLQAKPQARAGPCSPTQVLSAVQGHLELCTKWLWLNPGGAIYRVKVFFLVL